MTTEEFVELCQCGETTTVQYKECFTTQTKIAQEMVAFANTHGGVIMFGVQDKTGEMLGLTFKQLQDTGLELGNTANEQVKPAIYIETEVVKADDKRFLVCYIAEGRNKPYKTNNGEIWVKQGQDKRRVTENSEILELFQDSGSYYAEEATVRDSSVNDLEMTYLRDYFQKVYGKAIEDFDQPLESMLRSLGVMNGKGELTRAGVLYFGKHPQQYERAFKIKAVAFVGNSIGGSQYIDSRDIEGTIPWMFREGMAFLKSMLHHRQEGQNFNSVGVLEIPEVVLEELLQNALVHIDLLHPAAVRLLVFENRIEIINPGRLYGGLKVEDIRLGASKQRNPLMADFAARTMIFRGLGSGIVRALRENVVIDFINEDEANQFRVIIWRINDKEQIERFREELYAAENIQKNEGSDNDSIQKKDKYIQKTIQMDIDSIQKGIQKVLSERDQSITELQMCVLLYFAKHPMATRKDFIEATDGATEGGTISAISRLQGLRLLSRQGGKKNGYWFVVFE
ncbi:MAG: putative DNA binding domain-containing protein [Bacteroidales bacterium]|nr:putative DNA binding domain-containing protein [Bacteroidales bacterium]